MGLREHTIFKNEVLRLEMVKAIIGIMIFGPLTLLSPYLIYLSTEALANVTGNINFYLLNLFSMVSFILFGATCQLCVTVLEISAAPNLFYSNYLAKQKKGE